jgi:hypothetical protein
MNVKYTYHGKFGIGKWLPMTLIAWFVAIGCSTAPEKKLEPIDEMLLGVEDPKMQERWRRAEAEGTLPPIEAIAAPKQYVAQREPVVIKEPTARKRRPVIPLETVAGAQPFSVKPIAQYDGMVRITGHKPGVLIGVLQKNEESLELYYKLPDKRRQLAIKEQSRLRLSFRDEVVDSALQRRIILSTEEKTTPFVFIAEGSREPYKQTIDDLKLVIEQERGEGENPPVRVTYAGDTVTLKPGDRRKLGEGERAVEVYLIDSIAMDPMRAMLLEGQPFYINIMLYRAQ